MLSYFCFYYTYEKVDRKTVLKTMKVHKSLQVYKLNKLVYTIAHLLFYLRWVDQWR